MLAIWVLIFVFTSHGVRSIEFLVGFSYPFSILFMVLLLGKAVTLGTGVSEGIHEYFWGDPKTEYDVWGQLQKS